LKARKPLTENQKLFALLLQDQVHFNLYFGKNELTLPPSTRQKLMWNDVSKRTILATGRKSYKTGNLELRIIRKSLAYRQHERLSERAFGTPGENQLVPVRSRILTRINSNPLFKLMLEGFNKNEGMLRWRTNVVWHFRLDGTSGDDRNWVGLRLDEIIFDEAAFTCLPTGTWIPTKDGTPKKIEDIEAGDEVWGYWEDGSYAPTKVLHKQYNAVVKTLEIKTPTRTIRASYNHPFLVAVKTKDGKRGPAKTSSSIWELQWRRADKLRKDDFVVIARTIPSGLFSEASEEYPSESLCGLVGLFLGDGAYCKQTSHGKPTGRQQTIRISTPEGDKAREICIRWMSDVSHNKVSPDKMRVSTCDSKLANWFYNNVTDKTATEKQIPLWCYALPVHLKEKVIEGLLLTDGYFNTTTGGEGTWYFRSSSYELARGLRYLAWSCGWRVSNLSFQKQRNPFLEKNSGRGKVICDCWTVTLRKPTGAKFEHDYKWDFPRGLNRIELPDHLALDRIKSINEHEAEDTWDIETECHNFVAEGFVTHNTRQCHSSRKQSALPQCQWLYTGVPNSVRHTPFHELDQLPAKGRGWSHHKTSTYANPLYWSEQAREALIEDYGKDSPDYTTQVMGCWGVELYSSFPPDAIAVNDALPYRIAVLTPNELPRTLAIDPLARTRLAAKIQMPRVKAAQYVLGMDYGFLQDPTEIGVAYRDDLDTNEWRMLARLEVLGVDALTQAYLLSMLVEMLGRERVGAVCVDLQHAGLEIAHELTRPGSEYPVEWWQAAIVDLNSNGIVEVVDPRDESRHLKVRRKQYITQQLQSALLAAKANLGGVFRLWLGKDEQMFQELVDTREQKMASGYVVYIPRNMGKNKPVDHITDLLRGIIAAAAWAQDNAIGAGGLGDMAAAQGWGGNPFRKEWSSTWDRTQVTSAKVERY